LYLQVDPARYQQWDRCLCLLFPDEQHWGLITFAKYHHAGGIK
jgi:hypothetical protein